MADFEALVGITNLEFESRYLRTRDGGVWGDGVLRDPEGLPQGGMGDGGDGGTPGGESPPSLSSPPFSEPLMEIQRV